MRISFTIIKGFIHILPDVAQAPMKLQNLYYYTLAPSVVGFKIRFFFC